MSDGPIIAIIAGLIVGIGFIALLFYSLNPRFSYFLTDVSSEERTIMNKARQQDAVQLFLAKYPFAQEGVLNRDPIVTYDDQGNGNSSKPAITVGYYASSPKTIVTYEDLKLNNLLVRYEYPSLWVVMDLDGNVQNIMLRCGISYLGNPSGMGSMVSGKDVIMRFLHAGKIPC